MSATIHIPITFRGTKPRPETTGDIIDKREVFEREQAHNLRRASPETRGQLLRDLLKEMDTLAYFKAVIRFGIANGEFDTVALAIADLRDPSLLPMNPPNLRTIMQPKRDAAATRLTRELRAAQFSPAKA